MHPLFLDGHDIGKLVVPTLFAFVEAYLEEYQAECKDP